MQGSNPASVTGGANRGGGGGGGGGGGLEVIRVPAVKLDVDCEGPAGRAADELEQVVEVGGSGVCPHWRVTPELPRAHIHKVADGLPAVVMGLG